jgi:preprotein translocase subunit SecA
LEEQARAIQTSLKEQPHMPAVASFSIDFSNGEHPLSASVDISDFMEHPGEALIKSLEKTIMLYHIDRFWQEHLRYMDELRQAVQHASYEQKDPLLIYKFESYQLFTNMVAKLNQAIVAYFLRATLLVTLAEDGALSDGLHEGQALQRAAKLSSAAAKRSIDANLRVAVQYPDGTIRRRVLYRRVAKELERGQCILLEDGQPS